MDNNCGVSVHDEACTCDVVIKKPVKAVFMFDEVHGAATVARATGYRGEGGAKLAEFLEALGAAFDATRRLKDFDNDWMDGILQTDLRGKVRDWVRSGKSIVDLPDEIGESMQRIVASITKCKPTPLWTWDERTWVDFESYLHSVSSASPTDAMKRFPMLSRAQAEGLFELYAVEQGPSATRARMTMLDEAFAQHRTETAAQIQEWLRQRGLDLKLTTIQRRRLTWRQTGSSTTRTNLVA